MNRPLTAPEVRRMFAASDKAEADRLERQIWREQQRAQGAAVERGIGWDAMHNHVLRLLKVAQCGSCGNQREDCYCLPSS